MMTAEVELDSEADKICRELIGRRCECADGQEVWIMAREVDGQNVTYYLAPVLFAVPDVFGDTASDPS